MLKAFLTINFFWAIAFAHAQSSVVDSLKVQLQKEQDAIERVNTYLELSFAYQFDRQDSAFRYAYKAIDLSQKNGLAAELSKAYGRLSFLLNTTGNYPKALEIAFKSLQIAERLQKDRYLAMASSYHLIGLLNYRMGNDSLGLYQSLHSIRLYDMSGAEFEKMDIGSFMNSGLLFAKIKKYDSALFYTRRSLEIANNFSPSKRSVMSTSACAVANVYAQMGKNDSASQYYQIAFRNDSLFPSRLMRTRTFNDYARFCAKRGFADSSVIYAGKALSLCMNHTFGERASDAANLLSEGYERLGKPDSALKYALLVLAIKDTIFNNLKLQQVQLLNFDEDQRQQDILTAQEKYRGQVKFYGMTAAVIIFLVISLILYRNNRSKQKANGILESQKTEIDRQRTKAENALEELRSTQAQLIQSEKMASLGELTAGIAHEIQNPLNFVNNFSEVNRELLQEMQQEIQKGNITEVATISQAIIDNEEKINQHGKRADSIVKGMLQHSRTNAGEKTLTDLNALVDEYLRISYHGFRARDKSFNVNLETHFDDHAGKIYIIPQDIGRVFLNLFNNAFYAVGERKKGSVENYMPAVTVSTKKIGKHVQIIVKDNGTGISGKIKDKVFQPFFTTKSAGQGTGLGLSISYDIVKVHGGSLNLATTEDMGTEFIIQLPVV